MFPKISRQCIILTALFFLFDAELQAVNKQNEAFTDINKKRNEKIKQTYQK